MFPQTTLDLQGKGSLRLGSFAAAVVAKRTLSVTTWTNCPPDVMPGDRTAHSTSSFSFQIPDAQVFLLGMGCMPVIRHK